MAATSTGFLAGTLSTDAGPASTGRCPSLPWGERADPDRSLSGRHSLLRDAHRERVPLSVSLGRLFLEVRRSLTFLRVDGVTQPLSTLGAGLVSGLRLNPDQNNVQIDFFGIGFRAGETLRYHYKLESASSDWSAPAPRRSVDFANLAPARTVFSCEPSAPMASRARSPHIPVGIPWWPAVPPDGV
jgi:hypothetical protein